MAKPMLEQIKELEDEIRKARRDSTDNGTAQNQSDLDVYENKITQLRALLDELHEKHGDIAGNLKGQRGSFESATAEMQKWLTTVLVALNSGGIIAVLNNAGAASVEGKIPPLLFLIGIMAAFAAGGHMEQVGKQGVRMADLISSIDLRRAEANDKNIERMRKLAPQFYKSAARVELYRFLSLLNFVAGVLVVTLL
jgi:hypothetical protein